jgi:hypothetical protein
MKVHPNPTVAVLSDVVNRSGYLCLLAIHAQRVGVHVDGETFLLNVADGQASVSPQGQSGDRGDGPVCWLRCSRSALESARNSGAKIADLIVAPGATATAVHPILEKLLRRCFETPPFPLDDREELIYPALFGFESAPAVFWESRQNVLKVLRYGSRLVTSGLSEPWFRKPQLFSSENVSGTGYELLTDSTDRKAANEFVSWVEYVERGGDDIALGNWLEFDAIESIPKAETSGFLVVPPRDMAPQFPVGSSHAYWHQLLPISGLELTAAKCHSAFKGEEFGPGKRRVAQREPESKLERSRKTLQLLQLLDSLPNEDL